MVAMTAGAYSDGAVGGGVGLEE